MDWKTVAKMRVHSVMFPIMEKTSDVIETLVDDLAYMFDITREESRVIVEDGVREVNEAMLLINEECNVKED